MLRGGRGEQPVRAAELPCASARCQAAKGVEKGVSEELGEARRWTGGSRTSCVVRVCLRARRTAGEGRRWPPAGVCASAQRTPTSLQQAALRLLLLKMMGWAGRALVLACAGVWSCAPPAAASLAHEHSAMAAADDAPGAGASDALSCLLPAC